MLFYEIDDIVIMLVFAMEKIQAISLRKNLSQSEVSICPEYVVFAVKVKRPVTTSATPTVKREELSKQTFRKLLTLTTAKK